MIFIFILIFAYSTYRKLILILSGGFVMSYKKSVEELAKDLSLMFHEHNFDMSCTYMAYGMRGNITVEDYLNLVFDIYYKHNNENKKSITIEQINGSTKTKCLEKAIIEKFTDKFNSTDIKEITYNNTTNLI